MLDATVNAKILKKAIKASNAFLNEARLKLTEEGIAIRAVDAGNVCLTDIFMPREDFEEFNAEEEVIGVNVSRLNSILNAVKDEAIELDVKDGKLKLKAGNTSYSLALIDPSVLRQEPKLPILDLKAEAVVEGSEFKKAISMASKISDDIALICGEGRFMLIAEGDVEKAEIELGSCESSERVKLSLEYLKEIAKVIDKDDSVRIAIGTDLPVRINIESESSTTILYIIAPRIEVR